ncbi:MAG TPA: hypothetical protein VEP89_03465, partial [Draconibacterium sp.]|nr:hypothetical protein [Draconibacterium sp.]
DTLKQISNHKIEDYFEYNGNPLVYNPIIHNDDGFNWSIDDPDSMKKLCPILYDYYPKFKLAQTLSRNHLVISNLIK